MRHELRDLLAEIEECSPRPARLRGRSVVLRASEARRYARGLADLPPAAFTRHLLAAAGADERRLFRWRLEHKLLQVLVLEHYAPGSTAATRGVFELLAAIPRRSHRAVLARAVASGCVIKRTIGYCAGLGRSLSVAEEALAAIDSGEISLRRRVPIVAEHALIQERIAIRHEYRVHSFGRRVVEALTYHRHTPNHRPGERRTGAANAFLQSVLDRLPEGIVAGSLLAWDVARQPDRRFRIIEMNVTGVHPRARLLRSAMECVPQNERPLNICRPGYQCSAYFQGARRVARLVRYLEREEGMRIAVRIDVDDPEPAAQFYGEVLGWLDVIDDPVRVAAKHRAEVAAARTASRRRRR